MGKVICIENQKGGVGKTTLAGNVAVSLADKGKSVLMIDLDYQCSLTMSFGYSPEDFEATSAVVLSNPYNIAQAIYETDIENLSIIPASPMLSNTDMEIARKQNRMERLKPAIELVRPIFDYIIIDCSPALSATTLNALVASDYILIPAETKVSSMYSLQAFISTIETIKECSNNKLKILGVVATMYSCQAKEDKEMLEELQKNYNVLGVIKRTTTVSSAVAKGVPCVICSKNSKAAEEYRNITDKILNECEVM